MTTNTKLSQAIRDDIERMDNDQLCHYITNSEGSLRELLQNAETEAAWEVRVSLSACLEHARSEWVKRMEAEWKKGIR